MGVQLISDPGNEEGDRRSKGVLLDSLDPTGMNVITDGPIHTRAGLREHSGSHTRRRSNESGSF